MNGWVDLFENMKWTFSFWMESFVWNASKFIWFCVRQRILIQQITTNIAKVRMCTCVRVLWCIFNVCVCVFFFPSVFFMFWYRQIELHSNAFIPYFSSILSISKCEWSLRVDWESFMHQIVYTRTFYGCHLECTINKSLNHVVVLYFNEHSL